jgi:hypothetical protein
VSAIASIRKALAVVALVHVLHGLGDLERELHGLEQAHGAFVLFLGLRAVAFVLGDVERGQVVGAHLAQVVQVSGADVGAFGAFGQTDALGDLLGQTRDGGGVPAQIGPGIFDQRDQDVERLLERLVAHATTAAGAAGLAGLEVLVAEDALALRGFLGHRKHHAFVADQVTLEHVEHRRKLRVRVAIQNREGVDIAVVRLADGGLDGARAADESAHLFDARGELNIVQRRRVVRIGRDDAERRSLRVVQNRKHGIALGQLLRHLVERDAIDVCLGQLLGRNEARLVQGRQVLEQRRFVQRLELEDDLLDAIARPGHQVQRSLLRLRGDEPIGKQPLEKSRIARAHVVASSVMDSLPL